MVIKTKSKGEAILTEALSEKGKLVAEKQTTEVVTLPGTISGNKVKGVAVPKGGISALSIISPSLPAEIVSPEPMAEVGMDASYTHNLGNYQSMRVGLSLKVPCKSEEIDAAFDFAESWVSSRLEALKKDLEG